MTWTKKYLGSKLLGIKFNSLMSISAKPTQPTLTQPNPTQSHLNQPNPTQPELCIWELWLVTTYISSDITTDISTYIATDISTYILTDVSTKL